MLIDTAQIGALCADECQQILAYLSIASVLMLVLSVLALPWFIARLPSNFFLQKDSPPQFSVIYVIKFVVRNCVASLLLIAGLAMLLLPGQGLLCIVMALALSDMPGKWRILRRLVSTPSLTAVLNWIRKSRGKPPFEL